MGLPELLLGRNDDRNGVSFWRFMFRIFSFRKYLEGLSVNHRVALPDGKLSRLILLDISVK